MRNKFLIGFAMLASVLFLGSCNGNKQETPVLEDINVVEVKEVKTDEDMENVLKIIATVTIKKEEYKDDVVKALHEVVDGTHTEEGNISYELHQDVNNPLVYVFIEVWKSQAAIDSHNQSAHFLAFKEAIKGKVDLEANVIKKIY